MLTAAPETLMLSLLPLMVAEPALNSEPPIRMLLLSALITSPAPKTEIAPIPSAVIVLPLANDGGAAAVRQADRGGVGMNHVLAAVDADSGPRNVDAALPAVDGGRPGAEQRAANQDAAVIG